MAKIKAKLRPSSIERKEGTIYYCISYRGLVRHISTDIHVLPENWDEKKQCIISGETDIGYLQNRINNDLSTFSRIIRELETTRQNFSAEDIAERFKAPEKHVSVMAFMWNQVKIKTDSNCLGTAKNYRLVAKTFSEFLKGRDICFSELTSYLAEQYSDYLKSKGLVRNSLSFHMRILRAVYNKAVRCGYAEQTFPFRNVYTGIDRTRKLALGEDVISRLIQLDVSDSPSLSFAKDMFLFSFYTRGMAYIDIAHLRKSNIQGGFIRYARKKTKQMLTVRIEECMQTIIDRYADAVSNLPYVFPILESEDCVTCFHQYRNALRVHNKRLHQISELLGLGHNISSYAARHSWATTARNSNVPLSIISAGMGHTSERTTLIYLASLENSLIDCANKEILDRLNKSVSC